MPGFAVKYSSLFYHCDLTLNIGKHCFRKKNQSRVPLILAPMAGITDLPFRKLCIKYGASAAISEMISAKPELWQTQKSLQRQHHCKQAGIRWVQIAGADARMMALAAKYNADLGADIIDINMGCPAKKVCNKAAGSALLSQPERVADILTQVVKAVDIPVTLKIRTGSDPQNRNAPEIARIAQACGIRALTIHGRTRECKFAGAVEYDSIRAVKQQIQIPVIANGDIDSAQKARQVLEQTQADALMIGRSARGKPWIFAEIQHFLAHNQLSAEFVPLKLTARAMGEIMQTHVAALHRFYGDKVGLRIARKHVGWYLKNLPNENNFRRQFNKIKRAAQQRVLIKQKFDYLDDDFPLMIKAS